MGSSASNGRQSVLAVLDQLEADADQVLALRLDVLSELDRISVLCRLTTVARKFAARGYDVVNQLVDEATATDIGGSLVSVLADRLLISPAAAVRMVKEAADVGARRAITGEPLEPRLTTTAQKAHAGLIGPEHVAVIREFFRQLPASVGHDARERAEEMLGNFAADLRPDQLRKAAAHLAARLNPDGRFCDADRAHKRGFYWRCQDADGMSVGTLWATPELRATLDAVIAKLGAPGVCNPDDPAPTVDGQPPPQAVNRDTRTPGQRAHDALTAMGRAVLASGQLGAHRGLPTAIIVQTTLQDMEKAAGTAITAGGTTLPMSDVIRMAASAYHYLAIFDKHSNRPLYLGRTRIASADQRIVLHARDRGCTFPGCDKPGYLTEVHHIVPYSRGGETEPRKTALACKPHHKLADEGWTVRLNEHGQVEWLPPPHLNRDGPTVNNFHHPQRYLERGQLGPDGDKDN
ncbi:MAG TPA: HNH endonuclease signature motif containing protein [Mycobacterium sp.]|nr:HNH endonuclease signature motif containing protein [Mycobacterium sp.]